MLIDPFVVVAQIINFLILVALLKRFLYQPVTQAMSARSQRIERQLAAAASTEQDAGTEKKLYLQKQRELEAQKQEWLNNAKLEVELEQQELTQTAIAEVNLRRSQWYQDFEQDRQKLSDTIRDRLSHQVALATRKALSDLANADLETQIVATLVDRLYNLDDSQLNAIRNAPIVKPHQTIIVYSSFAIADEQQERLLTAIKKQITPKAEVQFETKEDLLCGIELRYGGYKISWNLKHYLTELETATVNIAENNAADRTTIETLI
ncbi:ATP F0F1 synthase subunit beta [Pleurocapsales cyanobacterium LEGE 10410]|nr:ATP F0F1 synthase subunit beta [Pleurocapsales cyanobacterium LEGE 10410]